MRPRGSPSTWLPCPPPPPPRCPRRSEGPGMGPCPPSTYLPAAVRRASPGPFRHFLGCAIHGDGHNLTARSSPLLSSLKRHFHPLGQANVSQATELDNSC